MADKLQVSGVTFNVAVFDINDDITLEMPDAVLKVELAGASQVRCNPDLTLLQAQTAEHHHRVLAVVVSGVGIQGDWQLQVNLLRHQQAGK